MPIKLLNQAKPGIPASVTGTSLTLGSGDITDIVLGGAAHTLFRSELYDLVPVLPESVVPVSDTRASATFVTGEPNADLVFTAVDTGTSGNYIAVQVIGSTQGPALKATAVRSGIGWSISIIFNINTPPTAQDVVDFTNNTAASSSHVECSNAAGSTGEGLIFNSTQPQLLTGGTFATPGPVGCLSFPTDPVPAIYRKTSAQTWTKFA